MYYLLNYQLQFFKFSEFRNNLNIIFVNGSISIYFSFKLYIIIIFNYIKNILILI